jgi:hypothetical protein
MWETIKLTYTVRKKIAMPNPVRATPKLPIKAAMENIIVGEYMLLYQRR